MKEKEYFYNSEGGICNYFFSAFIDHSAIIVQIYSNRFVNQMREH